MYGDIFLGWTELDTPCITPLTFCAHAMKRLQIPVAYGAGGTVGAGRKHGGFATPVGNALLELSLQVSASQPTPRSSRNPY